MSFTGDLEHLPIVDVIQLLHATRKSGTLDVKGRRGVCQLVFRDGYIVSASHARSNVRIGQVLVELKALTREALEQALAEQKRAGESRKPLVATLIEGGHIRKEEAFQGLETLIEMTIVEILTWSGGTFSLEVDRIAISDEYRYLPEKLNQDFNVNTQNALMDALRIYDEKKRDGELEEDNLGEDEVDAPPLATATEEVAGISAEDLGLDDLDSLERRIPGVFTGLAAVPVDLHQQKVKEFAPWLAAASQEALGVFLQRAVESAAEPSAQRGTANPPAILFTQDELLSYLLSTICRPAGILVFATNDERDLDPILEQSLTKAAVPLLIFDCPTSAADFSKDAIVSLRRQKMTKYPHLQVIQLASPLDYNFSLSSFKEGIRTVFPRPLPEEEGEEDFVAGLVEFLTSFRDFLMSCTGQVERGGTNLGDFLSQKA